MEGVDAMAHNWRGENNFVNPPFWIIPKILDLISKQKVQANSGSPMVEQPSLVSKDSAIDFGDSGMLVPKQEPISPCIGFVPRTVEKSSVERVCLATRWKQRLTAQGWSRGAAMRFMATWVPSTLQMYNASLDKLSLDCMERGIDFPYGLKTAQVADYLTKIAMDTS